LSSFKKTGVDTNRQSLEIQQIIWSALKSYLVLDVVFQTDVELVAEGGVVPLDVLPFGLELRRIICGGSGLTKGAEFAFGRGGLIGVTVKLLESLLERVEGLELRRGFRCRGAIGPGREEGLKPVERGTFKTRADIEDLGTGTGEARRLTFELHTTLGEEGDEFRPIARVHWGVGDFQFAGWGRVCSCLPLLTAEHQFIVEVLKLCVCLGEGVMLILEGGKLSVGCMEHVVQVGQAIDEFCPHAVGDFNGASGIEAGVRMRFRSGLRSGLGSGERAGPATLVFGWRIHDADAVC
jgi:hypothetical protein